MFDATDTIKHGSASFTRATFVSQITELSSELADERNTGESASQLLETETSERLRLEKDMKDLQVGTHKEVMLSSSCGATEA